MSARNDMPPLASRRIAAYRSTLDFGSTQAPRRGEHNHGPEASTEVFSKLRFWLNFCGLVTLSQ